MVTASFTHGRRQSATTQKSGARALFWGARITGVTGQSIVSDHVLNSLSGFDWIEARYKTGSFRSLVSVISSILTSYFACIFGRIDFIYLVCSRSTFGFLRDLPVLILGLVGKKVIIHVHGSDIVDLLKRPAIGVIARSVYQNCAIIIPSAHLEAPLRALGCKSVHVIENFAARTDDSVHQKLKERPGTSLLWNSNIMASKGIIELVNGAEIARSNGSNLHLVLIGKIIPDAEATYDELQSFITSLEGKTWISYHGAVSHQKSIELLHQADIVALPSHYACECQPLAIIQAMCMAKSVIIADTPALNATVGDYPAIRAERSPESIAKAIEKCVAEAPETKINQAKAATKAIDRFSIEKFDQSMLAIFA